VALRWVAGGLLALFLACAAHGQPRPMPDGSKPIQFGSITVTGSLRSRLYGWNWFQPTSGDNQYAYSGNLLLPRALGGMVSDRCAQSWGLRGRATLVGCTILGEGLALILFSRMRWLPLATATMMLSGFFIKMSNGATYAVVPFVNKKALGAVAGIVGAGGKAGSVLAGFLFKGSMLWTQALFVLGAVIRAVSPSRLSFASPKPKKNSPGMKSPCGFPETWPPPERWGTEPEAIGD
jgi:hypothetical protein